MADVRVWDGKIRLFLGEVVYAHHYVYADSAKPDDDLEHAFSYQVVVRAGGVQLWDSGTLPVQNAPITATPDSVLHAFHIGTLGQVNDFNGLDLQGNPAGTDWSSAEALSFLVSSRADITVETSTLEAVLAALGPADASARAVLLASSPFAKSVRLTIGHSNVTIALQCDAYAGWFKLLTFLLSLVRSRRQPVTRRS